MGIMKNEMETTIMGYRQVIEGLGFRVQGLGV